MNILIPKEWSTNRRLRRKERTIYHHDGTKSITRYGFTVRVNLGDKFEVTTKTKITKIIFFMAQFTAWLVPINI